MKTTKALGLIGGLVGVLGVGSAIAGTPFGGDDSGFIPPNKDVAKCEERVAKELGKAANCVLGCHRKRAKGSLADDTAEDTCESTGQAASSCKGKYNKVTDNASKIKSLCPSRSEEGRVGKE